MKGKCYDLCCAQEMETCFANVVYLNSYFTNVARTW